MRIQTVQGDITKQKDVKAIVNAVAVPVTIKCRLGWDKGSINVLDFTKRMEDCGASMVTVHGRTRSMLYSGTADWDMIAKVKEQLSVLVEEERQRKKVSSREFMSFDSEETDEGLDTE